MSARSAMRVHWAARGFEQASEAYDRGRPEYPLAAVRFLTRTLHLGPNRTVVELGSGTGKFTRALLTTGAAVVPVEPLAAMRRVFRRQLPDVPVFSGTAEAIPVPDRFADAVVVGQAFHWFRTREALREIARVLTPRGGLGLVWNLRDERVPWVRAFTEIVDRFHSDSPRTRERAWMEPFRRSPDFGPIHHRSLRFVHRLTVPQLIDRLLSISFVALQPAQARRAAARDLLTRLRSDPETRGRSVISLPYRTDLYWAFRRRPARRSRSPTRDR